MVLLVMVLAGLLAGCQQVVMSDRPIAGLQRVAVADFAGEHGPDVAHYLAVELLPTGLTVLDSSAIQATASEKKLSLTTANDAASAVALGKALGVQAVIFGRITEAGIVEKNQFRIVGNVQMVDVERGSVVASLDATYVHMDPLYPVVWGLLLPLDFGLFFGNPTVQLEQASIEKAGREGPTMAVKGLARNMGAQFNQALVKLKNK
jgi:hypothetical protein